MNYALVEVVRELIDEPGLLDPFRPQHRRLGRELLALVDVDTQDNLTGDRRISKLWATRLGLEDWFEWRTLESLPKGFRHAWE